MNKKSIKVKKLNKKNKTHKSNNSDTLINLENSKFENKTTNLTKDTRVNSSVNKEIISAKILFNLPNSLTFFRIILAPFFMWAIIVSDYLAALIIIVVASLSDFFDGFIARRFNMQTEIGRIIDPIADKVLIFFSIAALLIKFNFPLWIGVIIISRDIILLIGGILFFYYKKQKALTPNIFGKFSTFMQMITIVIYIIASLNNYYSLWIDLLLYLTVIATVVSGVIYVFRISDIFSSVSDK